MKAIRIEERGTDWLDECTAYGALDECDKRTSVSSLSVLSSNSAPSIAITFLLAPTVEVFCTSFFLL